MIFQQFISQEQRRNSGGTGFIELQYCTLPVDSRLKKLVSLNRLKHWQLDSLYVHFDNIEMFISHYGEILSEGIYNNLNSGPLDIFGINYFPPEKLSECIEKIENSKPAEYDVILKWLNSAREHNGFYVLGI